MDLQLNRVYFQRINQYSGRLSFLLLVLAIPSLFFSAPQLSTPHISSLLFNKQFLISHKNCQPVCFYSDDGILLRGLLRTEDNAQVSLVFCTGFFPGHKEGLATFLELVPPCCNVLFFDARGHGESDGAFLSTLHRYGCDEFKDVIGAIQFLHDYQPETPIILHGLCAGAFHAARALCYLQQHDMLAQLHIQGLVFDSGVTSIIESVSIPRVHACSKMVPAFFKHYFCPHASSKEIRSYFSFWLINMLVAACIKSIELCLSPFLYYHASSINLLPALTNLACPIWYIHARDDMLAPYESTAALAAESKNSWCWWPDHAQHAQTHLQYPQEYKKRFQEFINYCHAHASDSTA